MVEKGAFNSPIYVKHPRFLCIKFDVKTLAAVSHTVADNSTGIGRWRRCLKFEPDLSLRPEDCMPF